MATQDDPNNQQDKTRLTIGGTPGAREFQAGDIVGGTYEVRDFIGAGGMGNVYRVRHTIMQTEYALKTLSTDKVTETAWRRFQNEAQAIARMNHPNIVGIYNLGLEQGRLPYYVMDLLKGQTLAELIETNGPLEPIRAIEIFLDVSAGLSYAHKKGIIHRDIKPANVVILETPGADSGKIKIVDFGIAKLSGAADQDRQNLTNVGEICGSPLYMSPEQCEGAKIDARSDIYSLGCTLFEALTGSPPFRGRNALETMMMHQNNTPPPLNAVYSGRNFPAYLDRMLAELLAKRPMDRPQNMDAVHQNLETALARLRAPAAARTRELSRPPVPATAQASNNTDLADTGTNKPQSPINAPILIAIGALLVVSIAAGTYLYLHLKAEQSKPLIPKTDEPKDLFRSDPVEKAHAPRPISVKPIRLRKFDNRPFTGDINYAQAKRPVVFDFPADESIGEIVLDNADPNKGKKYICQGKQTIPAGHKLYYFPNETAIESPQLLDNFQHAGLYSVTMPGTSVTLSRRVPIAMAHLHAAKDLKRLDLRDCNGATSDILPMLLAFTALEELNANPGHIPPSDLANCRILATLKTLRFGYQGNATQTMLEDHTMSDGKTVQFSTEAKDGSLHSIGPLLDRLARKSKIEVLEIPKFTLNALELSKIARITTLRQVDFSDSDLISPNIDQLKSLQNLEVFRADRCNIDTTAISAFAKLKALREIHVDTFTPEILKRYRLSFPGIKVNQ